VLAAALSSVLAQASDLPFTAPTIDYHALAPEIILAGVVCVVLMLDLFLDETRKWMTASVAGLGLLGAFIPVLTLAVDDGPARSMFGGAYVVDDFSLVVKALFLLAGYVVVLLSQQYVEDGDYYEGEYYFLLLSSILGMVMMASSRDLISIFVALEFLSIPAYMMAAWRKRDSLSNEAGTKYYLLGVFASAVMLYGMSLLYGEAGTTILTGISEQLRADGLTSVSVVAIVFVLIGFAFKVSAVPFHTWAPDTYEGAPTPVTAFLSVASKAAGFVALVTLIYVAFPSGGDVWQPFLGVMAAITMTLGNLVALRQTNIVRMLAYSSISQGGFILMPLAVAAMDPDKVGEQPLTAVITYLIVYAAMNLGAFAVVIAVARKTRSGEISSYGGLISYSPVLATLMTLFMASLAGVPPLGGWIAKFSAFKAVISAETGWAYTLAIVGAVNSVIAFGYYGNVMREMWMKPVPDGDTAPIRTPASLSVALGICTVATIVLGVLPDAVMRFGDLSTFTGAIVP
jgi:NADH-quinone oxidoreductase subunit N